MLKKTPNYLLIASMLCTFVFIGCTAQDSTQEEATSSEKSTTQTITKAAAILNPTTGNSVQGTVTFMLEENGVRIVANLQGLKEGDHGFHIHENGDCSAPDGTSAGGHFNPAGADHAGPHAEARHIGDLGNITARTDGTATLDVIDNVITLDGPNSIIGRGVIVHANPDDLTSQPTGNAGGRLACGVIEAAND
ncbi:MAG: superoxide dismutase family protein [bacterium]